MSNPRILLISSQHLFGESMEMILRAAEDMELIGPWNLNDQDICRRLPEVRPSMVVIADESLQGKVATELTQSIIEQYPEVSVIRAGLSENVFRIFSTHTLPAQGAKLIETIRSCTAGTRGLTGSEP
jgi:DNA-binding NarL/FixJ family response regulator